MLNERPKADMVARDHGGTIDILLLAQLELKYQRLSEWDR